MGFHVIIKKEKLEITHQYVETADQLAFIDITPETIIYEGESHWIPVIVGKSEKYKCYSEKWFRDGILAQELFKEQSLQKKFILEPINQDQKSFQAYTKGVGGTSVKRGDFLIRNANNIEIDVKCVSFTREKGERYFLIRKDHIVKHLNMMRITQTPVIIAAYQRMKNGPNPTQLFMLDLSEHQEKILSLAKVEHKEAGVCLRIPLALTKKGFQIIEKQCKQKVTVR